MMTTVICVSAKNENLYINDWCKHYIDLGISRIYIFDNNDFETQYIGEVLDEEIKDKITIFDKRGVTGQNKQLKFCTDFYSEYNKTFDWCFFIDADEFLTGVSDINEWLSNPCFKNFEMIRIKWNLFGDDEMITRDTTVPVYEAFKNIIEGKVLSNQGKCIVKGNLENINVGSAHYAFRLVAPGIGDAGDNKERAILTQCLPSGAKCNSTISIKEDYSKETIFLNHYMTKTLSEFINQKYARGDCIFEQRVIDFEYFWRINKKTKAKLDFIEHFKRTTKSINSINSNAIDIVVLYVDSNDVEWQKLYNQYAPVSEDVQVTGKQRFRSNSYFKYWFRGVEKYLPWINNVFLVVQSYSQVPSWINTNKVKIVLHEDFIPQEYLPVFNSQAIEMFLHKIPDLSEKFLYSNDDMYFVGDLTVKDFFENNKVKTSFNRCKYGSDEDMPLWKRAIINSGMLVNKEETEKLKQEGSYIAPMHVIRPYFKSKIAEVHEQYSTPILESISKFRENKNFTVYLYDFYLKSLGLTVNTNYSSTCFSSTSSIGLICNAIINPHIYKTICINDTEEEEDKKRIALITEHFDSQLSTLSKYEVLK